MQLYPLGKSNLMVSKIGFGCMSLSPDQVDINRLIHKAIDLGIQYFDTADIYNFGENEKWLGNALSTKRKEVIVATKVGNQWNASKSGLNWNPSAAHIRESIDKSLHRLQTDYIDLYQLHGGTMEDNFEEIIETFEDLQRLGKIRYYGISSIRPAVIKKYATESNIVSVMTQYSMLDKRPETEILDFLNEHKVSVVARGVLGKGLLAGKPAAAYNDLSPQEVSAIQEKQRLDFPNIPLHQSAIDYIFNYPAVSAAVVGIRNFEQLDIYENFR